MYSSFIILEYLLFALILLKVKQFFFAKKELLNQYSKYILVIIFYFFILNMQVTFLIYLDNQNQNNIFLKYLRLPKKVNYFLLLIINFLFIILIFLNDKQNFLIVILIFIAFNFLQFNNSLYFNPMQIYFLFIKQIYFLVECNLMKYMRYLALTSYFKLNFIFLSKYFNNYFLTWNLMLQNFILKIFHLYFMKDNFLNFLNFQILLLSKFMID